VTSRSCGERWVLVSGRRRRVAHGRQKYNVPIPLLSDADKQVAGRYGVLTSRLGFTHARRDTFLIDPSGKIAGTTRTSTRRRM
jgi:peroxiredoxin